MVIDTNIEDLLIENTEYIKSNSDKEFQSNKDNRPTISLWLITDQDSWLNDIVNTVFPCGMQRDHYKIINTAKVVLLNTAIHRGNDIICPLKRNYWYKVNPKPRYISLNKLSYVVNNLCKLGYIDLMKGYKVDDFIQHKEATTIRATDKLLELTPEKVPCYLHNDGLVETKGFKLEDTCLDNPAVSLRRTVIMAYNERVQYNPSLLLRTKFIGDTAQFGRFIGSSFQGIAKEVRRKSFIINNEKAVELDVQNCQVFLALSLGDQYDPDIDYYHVHGLPREVVKMVVTIAINCESKREAIGAIRNYLDGPRNNVLPSGELFNPKRILDDVLDTHPHLDKLFFQSKGLGLMNVESTCMGFLMNDLNIRGIPYAPIHDGVSVPVSHVEQVRYLMKQNFTIKGHVPVVDIKTH